MLSRKHQDPQRVEIDPLYHAMDEDVRVVPVHERGLAPEVYRPRYRVNGRSRLARQRQHHRFQRK